MFLGKTAATLIIQTQQIPLKSQDKEGSEILDSHDTIRLYLTIGKKNFLKPDWIIP